jgi:mannosyltransferase
VTLSEATPRGFSRWFEFGILCQLLVGVVVVGIGIGAEPFNRDEVASVSVAGRSFEGIFDVLGHNDANSGLYYLLLHFWMWGGEAEGWVRALSALSVVATIPVTALLARRLAGESVGLVAGFALVANAFVVAHAQEARWSALALLLITLATWMFVEAATRGSSVFFVAYASAATLAVYAGLFSGLVVLAHLASLPFLPQLRQLARRFAVAFGAVLLASAPLAGFLAATASDQVSWIDRPGPNELINVSSAILGGGGPLFALAYGTLVLIGLFASWQGAWGVAASTHEPAEERWRCFLITAWVVLPPTILFAFSQAKPLFVGTYLFPVVPALAILAGIGLVALVERSRVVAVIAAAAVISLSLPARIELEVRLNEDLRAAAAMIEREGRGTDGLAYVPAFARVGIDWYLDREAVPREDQPTDFAVEPMGQAEQVGDLYAREVPPGVLVNRLQKYSRVWLVEYPDADWHPTPEPTLAAGLPQLRNSYRLVRVRDIDDFRVALYKRRHR